MAARRRPRCTCADLVVGPRVAFSAAAPRVGRRHHASVPAVSPIAAFAHSGPTRRRRRARAEPRASSFSIARRRPRPTCTESRRRPARESCRASCRPTPSRLCACCIAHRRVYSLKPNTTTQASARRAASESLFDHTPPTSSSARKSCCRHTRRHVTSDIITPLRLLHRPSPRLLVRAQSQRRKRARAPSCERVIA